MNKKHIKSILALILALTLLAAQVTADTTFTFGSKASGDDKQSESIRKIESMMEIIQREYYKDVDEQDLVNGAIKGMLDTLDPHSTYFTPEEYKEFMNDLSGEIVGIGIQIEKQEDGITVVAPIDGTPAYKAGLKTGDKLISVDGTDISGFTVDKAASVIRGKAGTKVKIGVRREGIAELVYFEFVRETIKINPVKYEIKDGNIGFLRISEFNDNTSEGVAEAIKAFQAKGVKGVVVDLRGNPGGLLDEVVEVCRLLIPKGPIVKIQVRGEIVETYSSELDKAPFRLAVLINGGSASASEIMAGAVKDSKTGILIGEKTYGKGTVQQTMKLKGGGGAKLTIANYLTPSGFSLDGIGIMPDIEVKVGTSVTRADYAELKGDRSLKTGMIGLDVLGLQQRLNDMGYVIKKQDGIFGPMTKSAVLAFQKDNGLKQDASIDPDDLKVIQNKLYGDQSQGDVQLERAMEEIRKMIAQ